MLKRMLAIVIGLLIMSGTASGANYPSASRQRLGGIVDLLNKATKIDRSFAKGGKTIYKLPGGQLYYVSLLDLDSDGSRWAKQDATGQSGTSLRQPDGKAVDSDSVPFFVLPGSGFYRQFGIQLGDIAAIIYKDRVEFAVFADHGPKQKLGEGSIALHRSIGHETIRSGQFHDEAIDKDVITIVFPKSGDGTPQTPAKIRALGQKLFSELGGRFP
ncbi:MAG: hypothetical protein FDX18_09550 [Chlorobium sp.]|nr:MAG: hypothetical protein FDX18_09550 [Chlorobium sp.]